MSGCGSCGGDCHSCSGCGAILELTGEEIAVLQQFAQLPFLPVARNAEDTMPVCPDMEQFSPEQQGNILLLLEKKGLISIDYNTPVKGYSGSTLRGSMALTGRGQQILELIDIQGVQ